MAPPFDGTPRPGSVMTERLGQQGLEGPSGVGVGGRAQSVSLRKPSVPLRAMGAVKELRSIERVNSFCIRPPPTRREPRDELSSHLRPCPRCIGIVRDLRRSHRYVLRRWRLWAVRCVIPCLSRRSLEPLDRELGTGRPSSYCYELRTVRRLENVANTHIAADLRVRLRFSNRADLKNRRRRERVKKYTTSPVPQRN